MIAMVGVDRFVDRAILCKQCNQGHRWHDSVVSVQLVRTMHGAVVLIIRRSWVRAPPAPLAVLPISILVTIKPALGSTQVRKVRGPILDTLYARLMRCGNLACTGKPFTEHRNIPDLRPDPADPRPEWEQAADRVRAAIRAGQLASGDTLPSVPDLARLQGLKPGTVRHMFLALAEEGLVHIRHGRTTTIAGEPAGDEPGTRLPTTRPRPGHDCTLSGCHPHVCTPMAKSTIHGIHAILSGAFEAAMRWEWTDRNPARSARPPTLRRQTILATSPEAVAKVIAQARARSAALGLYLWLVVVTGVRRGELCGLQIRDVDLDRALVHVGFNYVVRGGRRVRKDTKTHQDRWLAIDPVTCALIVSYLAEIKAELAAVGVELGNDAYLFSNDPAHARPWNPDWVTHRVADAADAAGVALDIKGGRHYTASQLLAGGFDLRNTAARLGVKRIQAPTPPIRALAAQRPAWAARLCHH